VSVNSNLFVAADGDLVAVEFEVAGAPSAGGRRADVVVFDISQAPPEAPPARGSRARPPAPRPAPSGKNAHERALAHGGVWEQRLTPCDQAGVTLTLKKNRRFSIRVTTRCQGRKDVTDLDGSFTTEGTDTVVLSFENEDGPTEKMVCRFGACDPDASAEARDDGAECLTCGEEDVSFTLETVRR
jgi:hypothetical protein